MGKQKDSRWFPTQIQLSDPKSLERSFRQLLEQHYALVDRHEALSKQVPAATGIQPGHGPSDTMVCGLFVQPVDSQTLADGTKLTYEKKSGSFVFK